MRPSARRLACLALLTAATMSAGTPSASAQIAYAPCGDASGFACGHLVVPLDPTGTVEGTLTLAIRRRRAPQGAAHSAIVALAGGPGQPALPLAAQFAELLGPVSAGRDLIVFDQRGVGLSHPLACHAFERPDLFRAIGPLVETCAAQLGPGRSLFATAYTVADIEALREAGGYEKLVLYGTSYGSKVAEEYAQAHPDRVEALVLDSVVTPQGPDPLLRSSFVAIPRVLHQICAAGACAGITAHTVAVAPVGLFELLLAGDFSEQLRAELLTAVRAAALGDTAPLARIGLQAGNTGGEREDFDSPLYFTTSCEDQAFPWSSSS